MWLYLVGADRIVAAVAEAVAAGAVAGRVAGADNPGSGGVYHRCCNCCLGRSCGPRGRASLAGSNHPG